MIRYGAGISQMSDVETGGVVRLLSQFVCRASHFVALK
jgi:hypothetical protein